MIRVEEARQLLLTIVRSMPAEVVSLRNAIGRVLAADIRAPLPMPLFDQSAVDGYVLSSRRLPDGSYRVVGMIRAGDIPPKTIQSGQAYRIFTGAAVPPRAYGVVMQEHVQCTGDRLDVPADRIVQGSHIRKKGGHFKKGAVVLQRPALLNAAAIGLLASLGKQTVRVYRKPVIGLLVTGSELRKAGTVLREGEIYESNSSTLIAALESCGYSVKQLAFARDRMAEVERQAKRLMKVCDVVLFSGGISVGDFDFVLPVLGRLGVKQLFYKVAQKPGKPLYAGSLGRKIVFALPGNPASALVCLYEYVLPTLDGMQMKPHRGLVQVRLPLASELSLKADRDQFLRARVVHGHVEVFTAQDSDNLRSFAESNALVFVPAGVSRLSAGEQVIVHLLPQQEIVASNS